MSRRWISARSTSTGTIKTQRLKIKTRGLSRRQKYDEALEEYARLEKLRDEVVKKMLDTFRQFIHETVRHIFDDILASKLNTTPWVNLRGVEETEEELGFSLYAFEVVWMFWMRSVFQEDAADNTLEYLLYGIKKPRNVAPRIFVRRVKQLSSYINYLPGAYYSSQATSQTTQTEKLTDPQVAQLAQRLCPPAWKTAWKMLKHGNGNAARFGRASSIHGTPREC